MLFGTLYLYGGTVMNNTAELYGGGVLGSPSSVICLKGNPKVFGNIANDKEDSFDNLYLDGNEENLSDCTAPIRLTGALTDGVQLGMTRWIRPDDNEHPYSQMIVPYGYNIKQSDLDRLCCDRSAESKELYADNMEKYALIPYEGNIVMVLAVDVQLDKERLSFDDAGETAELTATVTPANAPLKDVIWASSDENAATVDENGKVTAIGIGKAVITATTKSPYHAEAYCNVTVGYRQSTTIAVHGTINCDPNEPDGFFLIGQEIIPNTIADNGYNLHSLKAYRTDNEAAKVVINDYNTFIMPNCDVTVEAVFEPKPYAIIYDLKEGALKEGETNPDTYTIESGEIILNNPIRSGYTFVGWTGTELTEPTLVVKIPAGSTGAREYTAVWKEENSGVPTDSEDTPPESSILWDNDNKSQSEDNPSSGYENNPVPSESAPTDIDVNPLTSRAISIIPFTAIIIAVTVAAVKLKKK